MVGVATVALLERKPGITRDLFTRYWGDVHGVMAARIPGFASYTQHHVTPATPASEAFEGIAIVTFACEDDQQGLGNSPIAAHIHRDEANVFRRALLYNLAPGADTILVAGDAAAGAAEFAIVPVGADARAAEHVLSASGVHYLARYDLMTGDPARWNATDVDEGGASRRFATVYHSAWPSDGEAVVALGMLDAKVATYRLDETHVMVDAGRATPLGLRGWDAVRTIHEAGAYNQLDPEVERALFGAL